ncbi:NAD-dependent succinate-semialdehyde dehydrogenase [Kutzneria sp. CA-103260]|uniref:NAD-dependent succinate-semialdehyde dehydrogenase n=1 Tax=Kutzneria sp. CA-103260 TaxID=2802641 RepID=UPI001BA509C8|nr:NAD-dependent succinate-semialdehyde dehydrogenase [Kutzneria sp. CA-103260]QUQ66628.1 NAD-dependent succinate-semialdehyde dehydrogenase [Kutzneria sp. CA-103260]
MVSTTLLREAALVDGQWRAAADGRVFDVTDPATGAKIAAVPLMAEADTEAAIAAAAKALRPWRRRTAKDRAAVLTRWAQLMTEHADELAELLTTEQGKPLAEARGEIGYAISFLTFYAAEGQRVRGEIIPATAEDSRIMVLRQPIGVVGCITPWNFPAAMITRKAAPALAAGCTVVLKPAEQTPLSALAIAALGQEAGLPAGVLNVITGDAPAIGRALCASPTVRLISFTGSTEVGKLLSAQCADTVKRLTLELGGNAPFLVFEDADLDAAVTAAVLSKYRHSGQTCVCTNRFLVQASIVEEFTHRFTAAVGKLAVGNGKQPGVDVGPLIDADGLAKVAAHVDDAVHKGARLLVGGAPHALGGTFFQPTVLADVTPQMRVMREETFGPVAAITSFDTEEAAVELANDTRSGLAGYFFTNDLGRAWRVAEALEVGMVGLNTGFLSVEVAPFGGVKESGLGREGSHHGIEDFVETKFVHIGGISSPGAAAGS